MPGLHHLEFVDETIYHYLNSLHNTILLKDVISMDEFWGRDVLGIIRLNLVDFLLDREVLG